MSILSHRYWAGFIEAQVSKFGANHGAWVCLIKQHLNVTNKFLNEPWMDREGLQCTPYNLQNDTSTF
jgi:hypothetical protein